MQIPLYQVDAFTDNLFTGNPAAICILKDWLTDELMHKIALENNLSETAFIMQQTENEYAIRWFTITKEIPLCGHATLAAAFVIFTYLQPSLTQVVFHSKSGFLKVTKQATRLCMDFPVIQAESVQLAAHLWTALPFKPQACYQAYNCMLVYAKEQQIHDFLPAYISWKPFPWYGLIITAPSKRYDFVSRFFVPERLGEDPVTGSAHCMLAPYWAKRLKKSYLHAKQLSARGGELFCELKNDRVLLSGQVVPYLQGIISI